MTNICISNLNKNEEHWGSVDGHADYEVSWLGRVRHAGTKVIVEPRTATLGYLTVYLHKNGKGKQHYVHRLVASTWTPNPFEKRCVDHIDGDRTNNHHENLRFATHMENSRNRKKQNNASSIYKGVFFKTARKKWEAQIKINKKVKFLGHYESEKEAAKAYNEAAVEHFGDYAKLNKIED